MVNQKTSLNIFVLTALCGLAVGCNETNSPPASTANSTTERPTTVTANRPTSTEHPAGTTEPADRTNTGVNARDRNSTAKTPLDQNENKADIKITADIRKRVVDAKMSTDAHNVKIITQDGKVTLRGPVKTEQEKQQIEEFALAVAGTDKVDNQLEVATE
jgi:hyperosmotically inducible protein